MKEGKEPLRTFGDLVQFYQHKTEPEPAKPAKEPAPAPKKQPEIQTSPVQDSLPKTDEPSSAPPSVDQSVQKSAASPPEMQNVAATDNVTASSSASETTLNAPQPAESVG